MITKTIEALETLMAIPQWVVWHYEEREGKRTKVPYDALTKRRADSTDPATWRSYACAAETAPDFDGVGFVVTNTGYTGVDLDHVLDADRLVLAPWAQAIVGRLKSYTETTPSGHGVRVWVKGHLPPGRRKLGKLGADARGGVEMYDTGRFFTVTGDHVPGTPTRIEPREAELHALHAELFGITAERNGRPASRPTTSLELDDAVLLDRARAAVNGAKFTALWAGDTTGYPSRSEADLALCSLLAFWTGGDRARIDALFRQSGLSREKWDARHFGDGRTYGQVTIATAIDGCTETYQPGRTATAQTTTPITHTRPSPATVPQRTVPEGFVDAYVTAAKMRTDAPTETHALAAIIVLSALVGPWVHLPLAYRADGVRLVLWGMNIADSTGNRKTTVNEFALDVIRQVLGESAILPWKSSPEAFIQALADRDGITAVFARDEYTGLLASMKRGGYMAGLAQDFIRAYDGLPIVMGRTAKMNRTTGQRVNDTDRVQHPYLVKLCAATRTSFIETATIDNVLDGLLARFVFTSGVSEERAMTPMSPAIRDAWARVVTHAQTFHDRARDLTTIDIAPAVLDAEWQLEQDFKRAALAQPRPDAARPAMKRLAETVLKVAALLAIDRAEAGQAITITTHDFSDARTVAIPWSATTLALIADLGRTRHQANCDAVLATIRDRNEMSRNELARAHRGLKEKELDEIVTALVVQEQILQRKQPGHGHAAIMYRVRRQS